MSPLLRENGRTPAAFVGDVIPCFGILFSLFSPLNFLTEQGSRGCIPGSPGESGLVSRGSQGLRSPLESRRGSLPGVGDGQGGLACFDSWGRKE